MASTSNIAQLLQERFRYPKDLAEFGNLGNPGSDAELGQAVTGGSSGFPVIRSEFTKVGDKQTAQNGSIRPSLDSAQLIDDLRFERYLDGSGRKDGLLAGRFIRKLYYLARPLMPVFVRKHFQRMYFRGRLETPFPAWPVDRTVEDVLEQALIASMRVHELTKVPFIWFWPSGARSATIVTHDVETSAGRDFCSQLMDLDDKFEIKTSFQIVPEKRYAVPESLLESIRSRGFEINVHDLNHDGRLFTNRELFLERAKEINGYVKTFGARGFRSAVMYRNVDWFDALDISYDMSVPNVAHLDPQRGGCCTVFPFFIGKILELPVTTTQDYSLLHILSDYSIKLWKEQIAMIQEKHGLISVIVHPDYVIAEKARGVYVELLQYLSSVAAAGETWIALPGEVATWWRDRSEMNLVRAGTSWRIEGNGSERAMLAYAVLNNDTLTYELDRSCPGPAFSAPTAAPRHGDIRSSR